jgi:hypothetical protein
MHDGGLSLERWANFFAITATAAATLVGLLFVVITAAAERRPNEGFKIRLYLTPVVVSFGSVLGMAALLAVPSQTSLSAAVCCCLMSVAGVFYCGSLMLRRRASGRSYEVASDRIPYAALPLAGYVLLGIGGAMLPGGPQLGLDVVAGGVLVLLGTALRNSWSIAVSIVMSRASSP